MNSPQSSFLCHRNGENVGPYTLQQLRSMWSSGQFTADTMYWSESDSAWLPLRALLESNPTENQANPALTSEPPPPPIAAPPKASPTQSPEKSPFAPQQIKDGFGFSANTPIPASSIPTSKRYLGFLATPDFQRITYKRVASFDSTATTHPVDGYDLFDKDGRLICRVFINAYAGKDTERAPEGLQYLDRGFRNTEMGQKILEDLKADPKIKELIERQRAIFGPLQSKGCFSVILVAAITVVGLFLIFG